MSRDIIPVDANVELTLSKSIQTLRAAGPGEPPEIFGENSCRNGTPRSATVRAAEHGTTVIEMQRNVLELLCRDPGFGPLLEQKYRRRAVHTHLRVEPLFRDLPAAYLDSLVDRVRMVMFRAGEVIVEEGSPADAFYLIRLGTVSVWRRSASAWPINYLTQGQSFGEAEMLDPAALAEKFRGRVGKRVATCRAEDEVEVVRFDRSVFDEMMHAYPLVRERLARIATRRLLDIDQAPTPEEVGSPLLKRCLDEELHIAQNMLVLDLDLCTRCDKCVKACTQAHHGVSRLKRNGKRFEQYLVTASCRCCQNPKCLKSCPVDAIHRKEGLAIVIDADACVGCGTCFENCPYENITMMPVTRVDPSDGHRYEGRLATVCDLDNCIGEKGVPSCVFACPHDAAERISGPNLLDRLRAEGKVENRDRRS